jgi:purine nucleosidase
MRREQIIPLLFDTDIGSDIDDAVALAYLLREPRCELLGVTTVTGEPLERARLASAVCRAAGRDDVPIRSGADTPILIEQRQPHAPQKEALTRWPHQTEFAPYEAVPFMRRVIRSRPGEVTLLAVGPFTNVALLFATDPEIPSLLRRVVLMGGVYTNSVPDEMRPDWNAALDPHATARVFRSPVPELTAYGLDVTLRCRLPAAECRARLRGGPLDVVADMAEVWFREEPEICFHDPLAAVGIFHRDVCEYETGRVDVELANPQLAGMTLWTPAAGGPHRAAVGVRPELLFERFFGVVGSG